MEASHLSKSEQGDDGSIEIPLTQRTADMSPKDANPSPSTTRAPVDPLPKVANLLDDSVAALAASSMKPLPTEPSPQDVSPPLVGSSPSSMDDGDEFDPEDSESASTSDDDDYVLARTASTSRSDVEVAESIG
jgi:hypothetical protein